MGETMIIGMAGGTGSGKTTLTRKIADRLGDDVTVIAHDSYYRDHHYMSFEERSLLNYDHPDAYETELLVEHLQDLCAGKAVECPVYDFAIHDRVEETVTIHPARVIIVEGILLLHDPSLRDLFDVEIFVDCDADVRILRRLTRDVNERGRSIESVIEQYLTTVKPMHEAFVEPSKRYADVIIPSMSDNPAALELLVNRIKAHLRALDEE